MLKEALAQPSVTNNELVAIIKSDPLFCWHLYTSAKAQLKNKDTDIQSVNHMLNLFGFGILRTVPRGKTLFEQSEDKLMQSKMIAVSFFCAHLSAQLFPEKHGTQGERFFLPSLLYSILVCNTLLEKNVETLTSHVVDEHLRQLNEETTINSLPVLAERTLSLRLFRDCPSLSILRKHCHDPEKINDILEKSDKDRKLFDNQETGIYLLTHTLLTYYFDNHGKYRKRFLALLSAHLRQAPDELDERIKTLSQKIATPAFASLKPHQHLAEHLDNQITEPLADKDFFDVCMMQLSYNESYTKGQRLELARSAIMRGIGAKNCALLIFNSEGELRSIGKSTIQCSIPTTQLGNLFGRLIKNPATLYLSQEKLINAFNLLPSPWLKNWEPCVSSFGSIMGKKPLGIVYADADHWQQGHHRYFGRVCQALNQALYGP